ncbi:hypothetical protein ACJ72_07096 [Emergomyces africanus]|uniref:Uncharacterized protein n=1 Tax=Emergomyces africanus TaxID=1955775 RepID=A0A1B7NP74_9EURO|nr:hypothetical protein ACJ72_07096 [Emergomyces africanus]
MPHLATKFTNWLIFVLDKHLLNDLIPILLFLCVFAWTIAILCQRLVARPSWNIGTPDLEKPALITKTTDRKPGEWIPVDFQRPDAVPYPKWDVHTTKPIPYRPFKYGPNYFVTMGLRSMKWDEWIELDNHYLRFHADKARRILQRGDKCCMTAPEAVDGVIELLNEL